MDFSHASNSQLSEYARCGKAYELRRRWHVPTTPAAWLVGGSAVHAAIEWVNHHLLKEEPPLTPEQIRDLYAEEYRLTLAAEQQRHPDAKPEEYRAAARGVQNLDWWKDNGAEHVQRWYDFAVENEWKPAVHEGTALIEFDTAAMYGWGDEQVLVKGYADAVIEQPDGTLVLVDFKTGSRPVSTFQQLGLYACSMERLGMPRPKMGGYFMTKGGTLGATTPLAQYTGAYFDDLFDTFARGVKGDIFIPSLGDHCKICDVSHGCYAYGGRHADQYDPAAQAGTNVIH